MCGYSIRTAADAYSEQKGNRYRKMAKVILDAGHGGVEPGAQFEGRQEKNDTLRLAMAVGKILENDGVDVAFTRTEDVYNTPLEKAQIANREGGDFLISFHRNSSPQANQYSGVETLVFDRSGKKVELAEAINEELANVGFRNLGVVERPGLIILRRSKMPAVLVEVGFLNTEADNELFDERFDEVAQAIANGILRTLNMEEMEYAEQPRNRMREQNESIGTYVENAMADQAEMRWNRKEVREADRVPGDMTEMTPADRGCMCPPERRYYRVQIGAFRNRQYAEDLLYRLLQQNYPAYILLEDNLYKVQVGAFRQLDNAVRMEQALRQNGYATFLTT